jgi:peptidoglycan hydrolase-like protein with peptidoglycan-binding domain
MKELKLGDVDTAVYWLCRNLNSYDNAGLNANSQFDKILEDAVVNFQTKYGLLADGVVGRFTRTKLQEIYQAKLKSMYGSNTGLVSTAQAPADIHKNGYSSFRLRGDTADLISSIKRELNEWGAILTSAGGIRDLSVEASDSSMSTSSLHYTGRAIDLAVTSGMENPNKDPYIIIAEDDKGRNGSRLNRVFARAANGKKMTLKALTYENPLGSKEVTDKFVDLTEIMLANGFERIRAKPKFYDTVGYPASKRYLSAEWWHFQYQLGLIHGQTTFGSELKLIWQPNQLEASSPWKLGSDLVFGDNWG